MCAAMKRTIDGIHSCFLKPVADVTKSPKQGPSNFFLKINKYHVRAVFAMDVNIITGAAILCLCIYSKFTLTRVKIMRV